MRVATSWAGTGMACLLFSLACASPAAARSAVSTPADTGACQAFAKAKAQGAQVLHAVCGNSGVSIGQVDSYQAINVANSGAVLIDATLNGDRRLWLVSPDADGEPVLEELSWSVAKAAGRGARPDITGLNLDLTDVATGGPVKVAPAAGAEAASGSVDVSTLVTNARAMRTTSNGGAQ